MDSQSKLLTLCLVLFLVTSLTACRDQTTQLPGVNDRRYALNVVNSSIPAWLFADDVLKKMSSVIPGLHTELGGPTNGDPNAQIAQIDALLARGVNGIILCAADPRILANSINKARSQGVPVVTIFGDVVGSQRLTSIEAADRVSAFRLAENVIKEKGWDKAAAKSVEIMIMVTKPGLTFSDDRQAGIQDAAARYKALKIVRIASNEWSDKKGSSEVAVALQAFPKLRAVFGVDSRSAVGAISALRDTRRAKGSVIVTGWDNDDDVLNGIRDGWIHSSSAPNMTYMVQLAVSILDAWNLGYLYPQLLSFKEFNVSPLPDHFEVAQTLVTKDNVAAFFRNGGAGGR